MQSSEPDDDIITLGQPDTDMEGAHEGIRHNEASGATPGREYGNSILQPEDVRDEEMDLPGRRLPCRRRFIMIQWRMIFRIAVALGDFDAEEL